MEFNKSSDEKIESPSQDIIGHLDPLKREVESLEDFEDITKGFSSMKDITAQFLQYETDDRNKLQSDESLHRSDDHFDMKPKSSYEDPSAQTQDPSDFQPKKVENDDKNARSVIEFGIHEQQELADNSKKNLNDSFNDLMNFDHAGLDNKKTEIEEGKAPQKDQNLENQNLTNIMDNVKFEENPSNDEVSIGSDESAFIPKKEESSSLLYDVSDKDASKKSLLERKSSDGIEMPLNSNLSMYNSEPGLTREHEPQTVQEDGFHVKEINEGDLSDSEEFIPEPIAKDYPKIGGFDGMQFLTAVGLDNWFHRVLLNPKIESLVYWRDPKKSGVVFGSVLVILLSLTKFSLISVVAYSSLLVLVATTAFTIYKNVIQAVQKTHEGHPFKKYLLPILNHSAISAGIMSIKEYLDFDLTLNPDKAREISDLVVFTINNTVTKCRSLFLVEDMVDSIKFALGLWCLTYVGAWFNGLSLLIVAFVGLFTLPKVYENNKTQIDANLNVVKNKLSEITEKIKSVIPIGKKTEGAKDKSE